MIFCAVLDNVNYLYVAALFFCVILPVFLLRRDKLLPHKHISEIASISSSQNSSHGNEHMESFVNKIAKDNRSHQCLPPRSDSHKRPFIRSRSGQLSDETKQSMNSPISSQTSILSTTSSVSTDRVARRLFDSSSPESVMKKQAYTRNKIITVTPTPTTLLKDSDKQPHVLIGCRIFIAGRGKGKITGALKRKFHSTTFRVLFDTDPSIEVTLKLKRRAGKSGENFQILSIPSH